MSTNEVTYHVRDWIEINRIAAEMQRIDARREYARQLAELEARLAASDQVQRLAELGNVTDSHVDAQQRTDASGAASETNRGRASK